MAFLQNKAMRSGFEAGMGFLHILSTHIILPCQMRSATLVITAHKGLILLDKRDIESLLHNNDNLAYGARSLTLMHTVKMLSIESRQNGSTPRFSALQ